MLGEGGRSAPMLSMSAGDGSGLQGGEQELWAWIGRGLGMGCRVTSLRGKQRASACIYPSPPLPCHSPPLLLSSSPCDKPWYAPEHLHLLQGMIHPCPPLPCHSQSSHPSPAPHRPHLVTSPGMLLGTWMR